jgi:predicted metal-binding protein
MLPIEHFAKKAKTLGASQAKVIEPKTVAVGHWVRLKCQYGCGAYGTCMTCPPYSPTPAYTANMLSEYRKALLIQVKEVDLKRGSGGILKLRRMVADLERGLFLEGYYKVFGMASGPCEFCRQCDLTKACKHPYEARPSLEACGIDVYQTARNNGLKLEVVQSTDSLCSFVSLILVK